MKKREKGAESGESVVSVLQDLVERRNEEALEPEDARMRCGLEGEKLVVVVGTVLGQSGEMAVVACRRSQNWPFRSL